MGVPEYILGLLAILSGLAISDMVTSLHGLLRRVGQVRWAILPLSASLIVFEVIAFSWWESWRSSWDGTPFWAFLVVLAQLITLFLAAKAVLPDDDGSNGTVDLTAHYWATNRYVWWSLTATNLLLLSALLIQIATSGPTAQQAFGALAPRIGYLTAAIVLALVQRPWLHKSAVPIILVLMTVSWANEAISGTV